MIENNGLLDTIDIELILFVTGITGMKGVYFWDTFILASGPFFAHAVSAAGGDEEERGV